MNGLKKTVSLCLVGAFETLLVLLALAPSLAHSEPVYKVVDDQGRVHFTNKLPYPGAPVAQLPDITKGDFNVGTPKKESCDRHGGIDCQAGADKDGSVICLDGFKDAVGRFRFACSNAQLTVSDISAKKQDGTATVFVRNGAAVEAKRVAIGYQPNGANEKQLAGPQTIEAFGVGEYTVPADIMGTEAPNKKFVVMKCENCPG